MNKNILVNDLSGIGEKRASVLNKMGIFTVEDLLNYFPRAYENRSNITKIIDVKPNLTYTLKTVIYSRPQNMKKGKMLLTKIKVKDKSGFIDLIWFKQPYLKNTFKIGEQYLFTGKVVFKYGQMQMASPDYHKIENDVNMGNCILPVYSITKSMSQKIMQKIILNCFDDNLKLMHEFIPAKIRGKYGLMDYNTAIKQIHYPNTEEELEKARLRLIFDEFFILQLGLMNLKKNFNNEYTGIKFFHNEVEGVFLSTLPFNLTKAQSKTWNEIKNDLYSEKSMNRLVQGDVGSGKTIIAILSLIVAVKNGYQGCMMAPTEVLANQHYLEIIKLLDKFNIKCDLLVGSLTKKKKTEVLSRIKNGEVDIVVGTHALIQPGVEFEKLGLVITDEQHRFGVRQRMDLTGKGIYPNVIVMTATPIPRTLALILYGDLDISVIDELPPGRKEIKTYQVSDSYHQRIYNFIKEEISNNRQGYIICPTVEENAENDLKSVVEYAAYLQNEVFDNSIVRYIHGKMKPKEKNEIMELLVKGEIDILVSTTVIEVGVNVPNATIMMIENAERFGLAQLHQLRGRVGRGNHQSYCILVTNSKNKVTSERMKVMTDSNDGFLISEMDLKLRGPGDFFGLKQHGLPNFKLANIYEHMDILKDARDAAKEIIGDDKYLQKEQNNCLREKIENYFSKSTSFHIL